MLAQGKIVVPPSPVNRHPDPEAVLRFRFRVRLLNPIPPEPDPEVQILAALAHLLAGELRRDVVHESGAAGVAVDEVAVEAVVGHRHRHRPVRVPVRRGESQGGRIRGHDCAHVSGDRHHDIPRRLGIRTTV